MSEDKPNKVASSNVRLSAELLKELRKEAARYGAKGDEPPTFGAMLEQAWRKSREIPDIESTKGSRPVHDSVLPYESPEAAETLNPSVSPPKTASSAHTELGVQLWVNMLRYILEYGDQDTKDAITKNLERFHLLARLLNREYSLDDKSGLEVPTTSTADIQSDLGRVRGVEQSHLGGRGDPGKAESQTGAAKGTLDELPRKRRKH